MPKLGEFRVTPSDNGELKYERYGEDSVTGESFWYPQEASDLDGLTMSGVPINDRNASSAKLVKRRAIDNARNLALKDPAATERFKEAKDMGFLEKAGIVAGRETDKLTAGAADIVDFYRDIANPQVPGTEDMVSLPGPGSLIDRVLGPPEEGPKRTFERSVDQAEKDKYYEQMDKEAGLAQIAATIPYYLTGTGLPAATRYTGSAIKGVQEGVKEGGRRVGGVVGDVIRNQAAKDGSSIPTKMAREVEELVLDPIERVSTSLKARPSINHEFREGTLAQLGGAGVLGAAEGGLHYDESMTEGAMSSLIGSGMGKIYEPRLSQAPSKLSKSEQEVIDWAKSKGYRPLPGMSTGQTKYQAKESGLRNDERYSGPMRQLDDANDEVITRIVGETMGIPPTQMKDMTPDSLQAHMDSLQKQYRDLEAASIGRIDKGKLKELQNRVNSLPDTKEGRNARKTMQAMVDEMKKMNVGGTRDKRGRFKAATFDGKTYQEVRSMLKNHADSVFDNNKILHSQLKQAIELLDSGMEAGVKNHGGKVSSELWKDLNERYAMTKLVLNKGMDPVGGINMTKLGNHFMENDPERLLLNKGNRVSDLHKLAKLNHLQKNQQGSGLAGPGVEHVEKAQKKERARLLNTPAQLNTSLPRWLMLRAYQSGYPSVTGLAGLPRDGRMSAPSLARILEQGTDAHLEGGQSVIDVGNKAVDKSKNIYDQLMNYINK